MRLRATCAAPTTTTTTITTVTPTETTLRLLLALFAVTALTAGAAPAEDWFPSRYGAEDTLGAINELSPEKVLQASQLIRLGKTYALGVDTGRKTPAYGARSFELFTVPFGDGSGGTLGKNLATFNDDWMFTWLGIGTQIDGLGHFGIDHVYYNGNRVSDFMAPEGLKKFGTHELPPIVTRGVLLDIAALHDVPFLVEGTPIGQRDMEQAMKRQNVTIGAGDVVILHTGWQPMAEADPARFLGGMPGLSAQGAEWLATKRVVAVGADTWGLDALPAETEGDSFPAHQVLLAKNGIYILENIRTEELVADGAWEFMFVLGQPKFVGAVQMVINPIAIR